jgi:hypothetical protein
VNQSGARKLAWANGSFISITLMLRRINQIELIGQRARGATFAAGRGTKKSATCGGCA